MNKWFNDVQIKEKSREYTRLFLVFYVPPTILSKTFLRKKKGTYIRIKKLF